MVLEMIDAEALREMLSHSPWGRQFLETLFGQPDAFDMHHQVASGVSVEQGGGDAIGSNTTDSHDASYETAALTEASLDPVEPPGPGAFDNPAGYLEYLKFKIDHDIQILESRDTGPIRVREISDGQLGSETVQENPVRSWIKEYRALEKEINDELTRRGGPRPEKLGGFYNDLLGIKQQLARA